MIKINIKIRKLLKITNPKEVELKRRENRLYFIDTKRPRNAAYTPKQNEKLSNTLKVEEPKRKDNSNKLIKQRAKALKEYNQDNKINNKEPNKYTPNRDKNEKYSISDRLPKTIGLSGNKFYNVAVFYFSYSKNNENSFDKNKPLNNIDIENKYRNQKKKNLESLSFSSFSARNNKKKEQNNIKMIIHMQSLTLS